MNLKGQNILSKKLISKKKKKENKEKSKKKLKIRKEKEIIEEMKKVIGKIKIIKVPITKMTKINSKKKEINNFNNIFQS